MRVLTAAASFAAGSAAAAAEPATAAWNTLGEIHELGAGITPGICTEPNGTLHVVTMQGGRILHRVGKPAGGFAAADEIPAPEGPANYNSPHLRCDANGVLHLTFERDFTSASKKAWYTNRQDNRWKTPVVAIDQSAASGSRVNYPRLEIAGDAAYLGAFVGGASLVVKLVDLATVPRVAHELRTRLWVAHPLCRGDEVIVVGRAGAAGHKLQRHSRELEPMGEPLHLSRDTPAKTGEPTGAIIDEQGMVHVVGVCGGTPDRLWYTTDERAMRGEPVVLGPAAGDHVSEFTYPTLCRDARGRIYLAYRDHVTGEGRLTVLDAEGKSFAAPITFAPAITRRLRWNAPLAAAAGGGVFATWESDGRVFVRSVGASEKSAWRGSRGARAPRPPSPAISVPISGIRGQGISLRPRAAMGNFHAISLLTPFAISPFAPRVPEFPGPGRPFSAVHPVE